MNRTQSDRGATLVMAIVFVTVIGMVIAGALSYASVSLHASSRVYLPTRDRLYAADLAMKATTEFVKQHPVEGRSLPSGACRDVKAFGSANGEPVMVQVCPQGASSLTTLGGGSAYGLATLATGSEVGLDVSGNGGLAVNGNVFANSSVKVAVNSTLSLAGGVPLASGGCTGRITVEGTVVDPATCATATPPAVDPGYTHGLTAVPAASTGSSCNSGTEVATLQPGTWSSAALTAAIGSCDYVWLVPGVHHLDNVNWVVKEKVIGGTVSGAIASAPFPGGCVDGAAGAMVILGGTSTITLSGSKASLQVCGLSVPQATGPVRIAVYGPTSDLAATVSDTLVPTANPSGSSWSSAANAKTINGLVATYSLAKNRTSNTLTYGALSGTVAIPSSLRTLTADVVASTTEAATFRMTVRNATGSSTVCTMASAVALPTPNLGTVRVTLTCSTALVAPLKVLFTATTPNSGGTRTIRLDGLTLSYSVAGAKIAAQSGCVVTPGGCDVLSTSGTSSLAWFGGQVYLPRAKVSLKLSSAATAISSEAIVVRVLNVSTAGPTAIGQVASAYGALNPGDVTIASSVGDRMSMTCRVTYEVAGSAITGYTVQGCTIPR